MGIYREGFLSKSAKVIEGYVLCAWRLQQIVSVLLAFLFQMLQLNQSCKIYHGLLMLKVDMGKVLKLLQNLVWMSDIESCGFERGA